MEVFLSDVDGDGDGDGDTNLAGAAPGENADRVRVLTSFRSGTVRTFN